MPLARTPPQRGSVNKRAHTFGPLDAYPDGTPLPPDLRGPSSQSQGSQPDPTPTRGPALKVQPSMLAPASILQPPDERAEKDAEMDEEMEIEEGLGSAMDIDEPSPQPAPRKSSGPSQPRQSQAPQLSQSTSRQPVTPRRSSRRLTAAEISPTTTPIRPPPNAFSTPGQTHQPIDEDRAEEPTSSRLTRATTPATTSKRDKEALLATPGVPIDAGDGGESSYGRYYEALARTLRIQALEKGLAKLTYDQMAQCYPLIAEETPEGLRAAWETMLNQVRTESLEGAYELFAQYGVAPKLQRFAALVDDANKWKQERPGEGRSNAWRPGLTPQVLSTAANLNVYDESWRYLREEYLSLAADCGERLRRVEEKRARLAALDNGVSDAVVELGKTNTLFRDFPTSSMLEWAEDVGAE